MSEILFRGKALYSTVIGNIKKGDWVRGELLIINEQTRGIVPMWTNLCMRVDPNTVCQCTWLNDSDGVMIYEHDILFNRREKVHYCVIYDEEDETFKVVNKKNADESFLLYEFLNDRVIENRGFDYERN